MARVIQNLLQVQNQGDLSALTWVHRLPYITQVPLLRCEEMTANVLLKATEKMEKNVKKRTSLPCVLTSVEFPLLQGAAKPKDPGHTSTGKEDKPKGPFLQERKQQHRVKSAGIAELKKKSKLEISAQSKQLSPHQKNTKQKANKGTKGSRPLSAIT